MLLIVRKPVAAAWATLLNGFNILPVVFDSSIRKVPASGQANVGIGPLALPSPSRHIYKSLTIAVAFRGFAAFEGSLQHPIKVDGTSV